MASVAGVLRPNLSGYSPASSSGVQLVQCWKDTGRLNPADGKFNDPFSEGAGRQGSFFGRNVLPVDKKDKIELSAPREVASKCPLSSFRFFKTKEVPTGFYDIKEWCIEHSYTLVMELLSPATSVTVGPVSPPCNRLHNAVCDALKKEYSYLDDEDLYRHARLVTSAVIAKVHTIDWTVELLKTALYSLGCILIGMDYWERNSRTHLDMLEELFWESCGTIKCGLGTLYPYDVDGKDRPDHVDLSALEVYRDGERKVASYNEFRRGLLLIPISKWKDLKDDGEAIQALEDVDGDDVYSQSE
ncbi:alpha-dioxygenase 1-like [Quillaja saponaria]|uniref:Alpha-dioxygenase 1-like n=1 Tax=Quillaja saponaria TaxID=32244 RepID=A0AAD7Q441_QUISA|nr:alpha-dioxygenase 1-like [Quillaja saponaria]